MESCTSWTTLSTSSSSSTAEQLFITRSRGKSWRRRQKSRPEYHTPRPHGYPRAVEVMPGTLIRWRSGQCSASACVRWRSVPGGAMIEGIINEWLADCAELSSLELTTFANQLSQDDEIVQALYLLLEERTKYSQVCGLEDCLFLSLIDPKGLLMRVKNVMGFSWWRPCAISCSTSTGRGRRSCSGLACSSCPPSFIFTWTPLHTVISRYMRFCLRRASVTKVMNGMCAWMGAKMSVCFSYQCQMTVIWLYKVCSV